MASCESISIPFLVLFIRSILALTDINYTLCSKYHNSSGIIQRFSLPKQPQKSRSVLQDGSRSLRLFRKGKTHIIAKFHCTDLVICSHSGDVKPPVL